QEVRDTYAKIVWETSKKPSRGRGPLILFSLVLILAVSLLTLTIGPSESINELMAALGLTRVQPSHAELLTDSVAVNLTRFADATFSLAEGIFEFIIRLLWGRKEDAAKILKHSPLDRPRAHRRLHLLLPRINQPHQPTRHRSARGAPFSTHRIRNALSRDQPNQNLRHKQSRRTRPTQEKHLNYVSRNGSATMVLGW